MSARVVIADDHPLVRRAVTAMLEDDPVADIVGEAASFEELLELVERVDCDMVIVDVRMPGGDATQVVRKLRRTKPDLSVLVLSGVPEEALALRLIRAGASGYVEKQSSPDELRSAIHTVARGRVYVGSGGAEILARAAGPTGAGPDHDTLSERELQVLTSIGEGWSVGDIAERLHLSPKTVSTYRARIMKKMGFETTGQIMQYAIRNGLVS